MEVRYTYVRIVVPWRPVALDFAATEPAAAARTAPPIAAGTHRTTQRRLMLHIHLKRSRPRAPETFGTAITRICRISQIGRFDYTPARSRQEPFLHNNNPDSPQIRNMIKGCFRVPIELSGYPTSGKISAWLRESMAGL
jgi:hypothetical protein